MREKNLVSKFFENIDMDTGMIVYGVDDTMKSVINGVVETVVCWEGLPHHRVQVKNKETGGRQIL